MQQMQVPEEMKVNMDFQDESLPQSVKELRPLVWKDGDSFCCVLGSDPQLGIFGCGDTPTEALKDWDNHFQEWKDQPHDDKELELYIMETLNAKGKDAR
jgi:hypothetical protein